MIVDTYEGIKALTSRGIQYWTSGAGMTGTSQYGPHFRNYGYLYRSQTNVRMVVDFVARNCAQVGIQVFRRKADTDRERLSTHPLAQTLTNPNPATTRYRLIEDLMIDMGVYFNGYWLKTRVPEPQRVGLVRIPPDQMIVKGGLLPTEYLWTLPGGTPEPLPPEAIVHFSGYGGDLFGGISPLETLRVILEEDIASADYRSGFWRNAARIDGAITRLPGSPAAKLTDSQLANWGEQWRAKYTGRNSGGTPVLWPGMDLKPTAFSPKDSEFVIGGKLRREICCAMYHVPLTCLGILEHATFCLPGDVEVFTEEGPRAIREIRAGDRVWSLTAADTWTLSPVTRSTCTGDDEILTLRTINRTLRLNARHRVLARRAVLVPAPVATMADGRRQVMGRASKRWATEYVPAGDLRVGDTILGLKHLPACEDASIRLPSGRIATIGFLELCGLLLGDGNVSRVEGEPVGLQIARAEGASYMDAYRVTMGELVVADRLPGTRGPLHLIEGGRQTRLMSVAVGREFDRLGFSGTARTKRVPGWVFGLPETYRLALLRGFLDADGSCDKLGRLSFSSCSRPLLSQIRHLCLSVGVPVTNLREQRGQTRLPTGRIAAFSQWNFTCSDPGANRRIGSHTPAYQRRLAAGQPFDRKGSRYPWQGGRGFASETTQLSAIVQIDRQQIHEPVYDLTVEGSHSFIADGLVVHNSNMREQRKQLYTDCLGPWFEMLSEEFERQILPEYDDVTDVYSEFNINEKLKGDFEEQAGAIQVLVGRPVMTLNEGRARLNLPAIADPAADDVAMPLNMSGTSAPPSGSGAPIKTPVAAEAIDGAQDAAMTIVRACWTRQRSRLMKVAPADRARVFDVPRWNRELAEDLVPVYRALGLAGEDAYRRSLETAARINTHSRALLEAGHPVFTPPPDGILQLEAGS